MRASGCKTVTVLQECSVQLRHELAMQQQVNKQLMQRKQEVEWQLMAAVAEVCLLMCCLDSCMKRQQWLLWRPACMQQNSVSPECLHCPLVCIGVPLGMCHHQGDGRWWQWHAQPDDVLCCTNQ